MCAAIFSDLPSVQIIEFLNWLRRGRNLGLEVPALANLPARIDPARPTDVAIIDALASVPVEVIPRLVRAFCADQHLTPEECQELLVEITRWTRGTRRRGLLSSIRDLVFEDNRHVREFIDRYAQVKFHSMFVFLKHDEFVRDFARYRDELDALTGRHIDLYLFGDAEDMPTGYEIRSRLKSVSMSADALPALLIWEDDLSDACVVRLQDLDNDDLFQLMQHVVLEIENAGTLASVCTKATMFVEDSVSRGTTGNQYIFGGQFYGPVGLKLKIDAITQHINQVQASAGGDVSEALYALTDAAVSSTGLPAERQTETLELLEELSRQAALPREQRAGSGVLRAVLGDLRSTFALTEHLAAVWALGEPALAQFFGLPAKGT